MDGGISRVGPHSHIPDPHYHQTGCFLLLNYRDPRLLDTEKAGAHLSCSAFLNSLQGRGQNKKHLRKQSA